MTFTPLGVTAELVAGLIQADSDARPRNSQVEVGPSGLGTPCQRRLGYNILGTPKVNTSDPLPSWVGTAAHAALERALEGSTDWETELRVELPGYGIVGTADAYHRPSRTVCDWKFTSPTAIQRYKASGPGQQYRTQVHTYGTALSMSGYDVDNVAVVFIPRSGMTSGIYVWSEALDMAVVDDALARYEAVALVAQQLGPSALGTAEAWCDWCPHYNPASTDADASCPGHKTPTVGGSPTDPQ